MPAARQLRAHLVIRNGRDMRLVRSPATLRNLASNEVAIEIIVNAPATPPLAATVTIDLPAPAPVTAEVGGINYGDEEDYREEGE